MSTRSYRLVVVGCLLSWFLLGLHAPLVHEFAAHGHVPRPPVLTAVALLTVAALAGAWVLLRTSRRGAT